MLNDKPYYQFFKKIWVMENKASLIQKKTGYMVGDGRLELVIVKGNGYKAIFNNENEVFCKEGIYLGGHIDQPFEMSIFPDTKITFIKLEPWTAGLISKFNFQESLNQTIPLIDLNKTLNAQLVNLNLDQDLDKVLLILAKVFEDRSTRNRDFELIKFGSKLFENNYFDFKSAKQKLIRDSNLSIKSIENKFGRFVGLTPKKFANTIRFRKVSENLILNESPSNLTQMAFDYGYYDQAHFIRDCQKIIGMSPKEVSQESCFVTNSKENFRFYTI